jgi:hypothetical protein
LDNCLEINKIKQKHRKYDHSIISRHRDVICKKGIETKKVYDLGLLSNISTVCIVYLIFVKFRLIDLYSNHFEIIGL